MTSTDGTMRDAQMAEDRHGQGLGTATGERKRLAYAAPRLREFGQLHLQTQGNNGTRPDNGNQMTMM